MRPITVKLYTRLKAAILFICLLAFAIPQFAPAAYLRSITITKANSAAQSTLTPGTANLTADGTTTQVLTVTVKDANAKNMTSGGADIAITKFSGTGTISSVTDNGNGTYTAIITSPTAIGSGIFVATLAGEAVKGGTDSQTEATVTYIPRTTATATTTAQSLTVGTAMTSFTPLTAVGGTTPYVYSYTGTMPIGLSFRASTGAVTGTPTAAQSAANLVFSVHDANNNVASTTSTVSFTVNSPLAFGDSYSGGKVAYILVEGDPGYDPSVQHGLIAATADQSETTPYQAGGTGRPWAVSLNYSVPLLNTFSAIGTGSANTNEIIKANGANSTYAAGLCADYTVTESGIVYSDWYLPSLDELIKISPIITTPQYQPYYYWSSTQKANDEAFCVNPGQASLNYWYKRESCRVRAVRAF